MKNSSFNDPNIGQLLAELPRLEGLGINVLGPFRGAGFSAETLYDGLPWCESIADLTIASMDFEPIFTTNSAGSITLGKRYWQPFERAEYVALAVIPFDQNCPGGFAAVFGLPVAPTD